MPPKRQFTGKFTKKPFTKRSYNNDDDESSSKRFKSSNTASSYGSSSAAPKPPDGARHVDEEGNFYWELGGKSRRVTVSEFRGNILVSVREYYEKDGKYLPGKKGISMSLDQFNQLIRVLPALEEAIGQKSSAGVVRPIYTTSAKHEAPKAKPKAEIDSEDDEEAEEENKNDLNIQIVEKDEADDEETSDIDEKPSKKKSSEKSKAKTDKKPKSKKKKVPDSEDDDEEEYDFVEEEEEDSEEE